MAEIIEQGEVNIAGTILCTGGTGISTRLFVIRAYNNVPYVLRLERYSNDTATTETLFEFTLDAGDTVTDTTLYFLKNLDQLILYSDAPGTSYYIYGQGS
jgi:hypothetical protein